MTEIKNIDGKLFSFDENETTLAKEIEKYKNLAFADLKGANIRLADLEGADISFSNLKGANLENANLKGADLRGADLAWANMRGAYLMGADLSGADLKGADLRGANLEGANLFGADLAWANLKGANLTDADFCGADLERANLWGARIKDAKNLPELPLACPSEGSFVAWKKVYNYLVKLEIPEDAKRSSAATNKCRCDKALVLDIEDLYTGVHLNKVVNYNYCECVYEVGKMAYPDSFDENRWNECSYGIHFFMDQMDAVDCLI